VDHRQPEPDHDVPMPHLAFEPGSHYFCGQRWVTLAIPVSSYIYLLLYLMRVESLTTVYVSVDGGMQR